MTPDQLRNLTILIVGGVISLIFLGIFMYLRKYNAEYMTLEIHWIGFAALPFFAALLFSGIITKFDAFGISFERAVSKPAKPDELDGNEYLESLNSEAANLADEGAQEKLSKEVLKNMPLEEKLHMRILKFRTGRRAGHYKMTVIRRYIEILSNLEKFVVLHPNGEYLGSLDLRAVIDQLNRANDASIADLITCLEDGSIDAFQSKFGKNFSVSKMTMDTSMEEAYRHLLAQGQSRIAAVDAANHYRGDFTRSSLAEKIAEKAMEIKKDPAA